MYWNKEEGIIINMLWYVALVVCFFYYGTIALKNKVKKWYVIFYR